MFAIAVVSETTFFYWISERMPYLLFRWDGETIDCWSWMFFFPRGNQTFKTRVHLALVNSFSRGQDVKKHKFSGVISKSIFLPPLPPTLEAHRDFFLFLTPRTCQSHGGNGHKSLGITLRVFLPEIFPLNLVHTYSPVTSELPFKDAYHFPPAAFAFG